VTGSALGPKTMILSRTGPHAPYYSGLSLSKVMMVERAFMRNTFRMSIPNSTGPRRKFLFSVDESQLHLAGQLERQIAEASNIRISQASNEAIRHKIINAAQLIAFKVLQDSLLTESLQPPSGHLLKRPLQQQAVQRTGKDLTILCRQNSLLSNVLLRASGF